LRTADELFPDQLTMAMEKIGELRYGENPHQLAAFYADSTIRNLPRGVVSGRQLHGKQLSFTNTYDLDAAWRIVADFRDGQARQSSRPGLRRRPRRDVSARPGRRSADGVRRRGEPQSRRRRG